MIKFLHSSSGHRTPPTYLRFTTAGRVDQSPKIGKLIHTLNILPTHPEGGWDILSRAQCLDHRLLPVDFQPKGKRGSFLLKRLEYRNKKLEHLGQERHIVRIVQVRERILAEGDAIHAPAD